MCCEHVYENKVCEQKLGADKDKGACKGKEIARRRANNKWERKTDHQGKGKSERLSNRDIGRAKKKRKRK